jgi:hypothetical protein
MPREIIVDLPCRVKHELGQGDLRRGSRELVNRMRALELVDAVTARPRQDGRPVEAVAVNFAELTDHGLEPMATTIGALAARTADMPRHGSVCTNCPANALRRPFGCIGGIPFPIKRAVEVYALERLASPLRLGGAMFFQHLTDTRLEALRAREFRADSKFDAMSPQQKPLPENAFQKRSLNSDELFEALLQPRGRLEPWLALAILLWFEAILLDEKPPTSAEDVLALTRMDPADRVRRTRSHLGSPAKDYDAEPFRGLLKLLHTGWSRSVDVAIES